MSTSGKRSSKPSTEVDHKELREWVQRRIKVQVRPLLVSGMVCTTKDKKVLGILLDEEQSDEQLTISAWHEVVHILKAIGGDSQDEKEVEAAAAKLARYCPEIVFWLGVKPWPDPKKKD